MTTISVAEAKANLSKYMGLAEQSREEIVITKRGQPSVVLIDARRWEWLKQMEVDAQRLRRDFAKLDPLQHSDPISYAIEGEVASKVAMFDNDKDASQIAKELRQKGWR